MNFSNPKSLWKGHDALHRRICQAVGPTGCTNWAALAQAVAGNATTTAHLHHPAAIPPGQAMRQPLALPGTGRA